MGYTCGAAKGGTGHALAVCVPKEVKMKKDVNVRQFLLCDGLGTLTLVILLILVAMFQMGCGRASFNTSKLSCAVVGNEIQCPNGSVFPLPKDGRDGAPGAPGLNGEDGKDGADGADGQDGADGADGQDGTKVIVVYPCGQSNPHDEVVLFIDGVPLAWFKNVGLVVLQEGVLYQTTDDLKCKFRIIDGQVVPQ